MRILFALPILLAGCAGVVADTAPLSGEWGGAHVALHLAPNGGTLDYDCAGGTIGPIIPGSGGRFTATGTHTPGHGGPDRLGDVPIAFPADYAGTVSGDRMTLTVTIEPDTALGPYTLRRDETATLLRCL